MRRNQVIPLYGLRDSLIYTVETQMNVSRLEVLTKGKNFQGLASRIAELPPFFFHAEFIDFVIAQSTGIDFVWQPEIAISPSGFACLGMPLVFRDISEGRTRDVLGSDVTVFAFFWLPVPGGTQIFMLLRDAELELDANILVAGKWLFGEVLSKRIAKDEEELLNDSPQPVFRMILPAVAELLLMASQNIVTHTPERLPRNFVRRGYAKQTEGNVNVVHLRRRVPAFDREGDRDRSIDWSHRWVVRGHWRNQWHPNSKRYAPVWVMPHVKGPEDKPLIVKQTQYMVDQ